MSHAKIIVYATLSNGSIISVTVHTDKITDAFLVIIYLLELNCKARPQIYFHSKFSFVWRKQKNNKQLTAFVIRRKYNFEPRSPFLTFCVMYFRFYVLVCLLMCEHRTGQASNLQLVSSRRRKRYSIRHEGYGETLYDLLWRS